MGSKPSQLPHLGHGEIYHQRKTRNRVFQLHYNALYNTNCIFARGIINYYQYVTDKMRRKNNLALLTMLMDDHSNADAIHVETVKEVLYTIINVRRNTTSDSQPTAL